MGTKAAFVAFVDCPRDNLEILLSFRDNQFFDSVIGCCRDDVFLLQLVLSGVRAGSNNVFCVFTGQSG